MHPLNIEHTQYLVDKIRENFVKATVLCGRAKVDGSIATVDNFSRFSNEEKTSPEKPKVIEGMQKDQIDLDGPTDPFVDPGDMAAFICLLFGSTELVDGFCPIPPLVR